MRWIDEFWAIYELLEMRGHPHEGRWEKAYVLTDLFRWNYRLRKPPPYFYT